MRDFLVKKYTQDQKNVWDSFVFDDKTVLGTFLQSRNFLDYHPETRFKDFSLMIYDEKNNLLALLPACEINQNNKKILFSHKGSTFGGLIILKKRYTAEYVQSIILSVEKFCKLENFDQIYLKLTPNIYSHNGNELLEYILTFNGYNEYKELSTYINFRNYKHDILSNFEQGKRTNVNNCLKNDLKFCKLTTDKQINDFYIILCNNLAKYETKPVHSFEEVIEFKNERLKDIVEFYGIYKNNLLIAGSMVFIFNNCNVMHTQYLCAMDEYDKLSPMTFMYYSLIKSAIERGFDAISWGTSTEDCGKKLNFGLIRSKEAFGGGHYLNTTYYKEF